MKPSLLSGDECDCVTPADAADGLVGPAARSGLVCLPKPERAVLLVALPQGVYRARA